MPSRVCDQLVGAGVDLGARCEVRVRWDVHCDESQLCRFAAVGLRTREEAQRLATKHRARAQPQHRCRIDVVVTIEGACSRGDAGLVGA